MGGALGTTWGLSPGAIPWQDPLGVHGGIPWGGSVGGPLCGVPPGPPGVLVTVAPASAGEENVANEAAAIDTAGAKWNCGSWTSGATRHSAT